MFSRSVSSLSEKVDILNYIGGVGSVIPFTETSAERRVRPPADQGLRSVPVRSCQTDSDGVMRMVVGVGYSSSVYVKAQTAYIISGSRVRLLVSRLHDSNHCYTNLSTFLSGSP